MKTADSDLDLCLDGKDHLWRLRTARGHDQVHCTRCQRCLSVRAMLLAYIKMRGGQLYP